jgi:hypothetical protein
MCACYTLHTHYHQQLTVAYLILGFVNDASNVLNSSSISHCVPYTNAETSSNQPVVSDFLYQIHE